jgi:hypothetical protein
MTADRAKATVRSILDAIDGHRLRDLHVPHGFTVEDVAAEERANPFAPGVLSHWRVTIRLDVPVLYTPDSSRGVLRAALPAHRDNLDALRAWIVENARVAPARQVELSDWRVSPDEPPAPYLPTGEPNGPPANWSVGAVIDIV